MNRSFNPILNESLGSWVAASERDSARGKPNKSVNSHFMAAAILAVFAPVARTSLIETRGCGAVEVVNIGPDGVTTYTNRAITDSNGYVSPVVGCSAQGNNSLEVTLHGAFTTATGQRTTAFGLGAFAAQFATAVGLQATASGSAASVLGFNALHRVLTASCSATHRPQQAAASWPSVRTQSQTTSTTPHSTRTRSHLP